MKKLLSLVLALALCLSAVAAVAEAVPSKTTGDLVEVTAEGLTIEVNDDAAAPELAKLAAAESIQDYFGDVVTEDGAVAPLAENLKIDEFFAIEVSGYTEGDVELTISVATPYEAGEEVIVLIGVVEDGIVTWYAFNGVAGEDGVVVTLPAETMAAINGTTALVAVASENK